MPVTLGKYTIRNAINMASAPTFGNFYDYGRSLTQLVFPRGVDIDIPCGVFDGNIRDTVAPVEYDLTDVATINFKMMPGQDPAAGGELIDKSISAGAITAALAAADFKAGTAQHFTISLTDDETNIAFPAPTPEEASYWMNLTAILNDGTEVSLGAELVKWVETNNNVNGTPPANPGETLSAGAIQALIDNAQGVTTAYAIGSGVKTGAANWKDSAGVDTVLASAPTRVIADCDIGGKRVTGIVSKTTTGFTWNLSSDNHSGGNLTVSYWPN